MIYSHLSRNCRKNLRTFSSISFGMNRRLRQFFPLLECMLEDTDGEGRVKKDLEITARLAVRGEGGGVGGGGHPLA